MSDNDKPLNEYEKLRGKRLSSEELAETKFNLVTYLELLIEMDRQHKDWLELQANKKSSAKDPP